MTLESRRFVVHTLNFGAVEVEEDRILFFKEGIPGFPRAQRFALLEFEETKPFRYLQSLGDPPVALLVLDPFLVERGYQVKLSPSDLEDLGAASLADLSVWSVATIPSNPAEATVNLMAPLVVNAKARCGKQIILHDSGYSVRRPLAADPAAARAGGGDEP